MASNEDVQKHEPVAAEVDDCSPVALLRSVHAAFRDEAASRAVKLRLVLPAETKAFDLELEPAKQALNDMARVALDNTEQGTCVTFQLESDGRTAFFTIESGRSASRPSGTVAHASHSGAEWEALHKARQIAEAHHGLLTASVFRKNAMRLGLALPITRPSDAFPPVR
jgi:hypothetical protein